MGVLFFLIGRQFEEITFRSKDSGKAAYPECSITPWRAVMERMISIRRVVFRRTVLIKRVVVDRMVQKV